MSENQIDAALATLSDAAAHGVSEGFYGRKEIDDAYKSVKAELSRLRELCVAIDTGTFDTQRERAEAAEAKNAKLSALIVEQEAEYRKEKRAAEARRARLQQALAKADKAASKAHDAMWAMDFDKTAASSLERDEWKRLRERASKAVWVIHNLLRPLIDEGEALAGPGQARRGSMRELDTSGPTALATVKLETGGTKDVRLYVREDGVVVAKDMLDTPAIPPRPPIQPPGHQREMADAPACEHDWIWPANVVCAKCGISGGDTPADKDVSINNLRGISDYIAEKISDGIGHDRLIPLDKVGEYAFIETEGCAVYLITIQNARLVLAASQEGK